MPRETPTLASLVREHTFLADEDIAILEDVAAKLPLFSEIADCDLFIDCLLKNRREAVVICEQKPEGGTLPAEIDVGKIINKETEPGVMRTLLTGLTSKKVKGISLEMLPIYQTAVPICNRNKDVIGVLISEEKIREGQLDKRQMEELAGKARNLAEQVAELNNNLWLFTKHISDAILIFDHNENVVHANYEAVELYRKLGFMEDLRDLGLRNLILDRDMYEGVHYGRHNSKKEIDINGMTLETQCILMDLGDRSFIAMVLRDVSAIRDKDRELVLSKVILQEVHHRTKNSLQTIASILRLQAGMSEHEAVKKALGDNVNRILSMAATHDLLVRSGSDALELKVLLEKVTSGISRYASGKGKEIGLSVEGDEVTVPSDMATTAALVVNELVSNALEHAFAGQESGTVRVVLRNEGFWASVAVIDNGCGIPLYKNIPDGLGLSIVRNLVTDKLRGRLEFAPVETGTHVTFTVYGI